LTASRGEATGGLSCPYRLKTEARLHLDYAACQRRVGNPKEAIRTANRLRVRGRINGDGADLLAAERSQVQLVEQIIKVGANIDFRVFT
jgi:hypothetical protein